MARMHRLIVGLTFLLSAACGPGLEDEGYDEAAQALTGEPVTALTIGDVSAIQVSATTHILRWRTSVPARSDVYYACDGGATRQITDPVYVTDHAVRMDNCGVLGWYQIVATGEDGRTRSYDSYNGTRLPLAISAVSVVRVGATVALLRWRTNYPTRSVVQWRGDDGVVRQITDAAYVNDHAVRVEGPVTRGFAYRITATDAVNRTTTYEGAAAW